MKLSLQRRIVITALITLLVWVHIVWDYFHGGIPTHYLLHNDNLPGIPNWLGGLVLPFFTWFLLYRIHKRIDGSEKTMTSESLRSVIIRFLVALFAATTISILFTFDIEMIEYIMLGIFLLALIFPLYKSEYLLGWVMGSAFTFGAIIPIGFGSVFVLVFYFFYRISRFVVGLIKPTNSA